MQVGQLAPFTSGCLRIGQYAEESRVCLLLPPLPRTLGTWAPGQGRAGVSVQLCLRRGAGSLRGSWQAATGTAPITLSPDLIFH